MAHPRDLTQTLAKLTGSLLDSFDLLDLLNLLVERCVTVFDVAAAGVMLAADDQKLQVVASSSEAVRVLELFEMQAEEGPCLDSFRSGKRVENVALTSTELWPRFAPAALAAGFSSASSLPLRVQDVRLGALNLFNTGDGTLDTDELDAAQALADVASIAIVQHHVVVDTQTLNQQLTTALRSRVTLEQAKGVLAERFGLDVEGAFVVLRSHARREGIRLHSLAADVVAGEVEITHE